MRTPNFRSNLIHHALRDRLRPSRLDQAEELVGNVLMIGDSIRNGTLSAGVSLDRSDLRAGAPRPAVFAAERRLMLFLRLLHMTSVCGDHYHHAGSDVQFRGLRIAPL